MAHATVFQTQVEEALDSVCDIVPHFLHDTCSDFTGQLKDQLEDIAESDPADACEQVGLCPEEPEQPKPAAGNGFVCEACKWCVVPTVLIPPPHPCKLSAVAHITSVLDDRLQLYALSALCLSPMYSFAPTIQDNGSPSLFFVHLGRGLRLSRAAPRRTSSRSSSRRCARCPRPR